MLVSAKDFCLKISMLIDVFIKGNILFGMWKEQNSSVDEIVRNMRKGRNFD
jgi:hypothetical protein